MPALRIALAQTSPVSAPRGNPPRSGVFAPIDANLRDMAQRVAEAKKNGADVVVFPEYFTQGICDGCEYMTLSADHIMTFIRDLAKKEGIAICGTVVIGTPHDSVTNPVPEMSPFKHLLGGGDPEPTPEQVAWDQWMQVYEQTEETRPVLNNAAFFVDDKGDVLGIYHKRNLWHPERAYLTPGTADNKAFDTKWGKVGMLICWDMSHPSDAQALSEQGVDLIFVPTYWLATDSHPALTRHKHQDNYERNMVTSLCFARATETETIWAMCNPGGKADEGFMGGSGVWQPLRGRVGGFEANDVGIAYCDVNTDDLSDARELYKIREDFARASTMERHPGNV